MKTHFNRRMFSALTVAVGLATAVVPSAHAGGLLSYPEEHNTFDLPGRSFNPSTGSGISNGGGISEPSKGDFGVPADIIAPTPFTDPISKPKPCIVHFPFDNPCL
jgi:hypothetical protein